MDEFTGRIRGGVSFTEKGNPIVTLELNERIAALQMFGELSEKEKLTVKIGEFRKKRSLDANAYCWVLLGKLAEKLSIPVVDVYRQAVKEVGGNTEIVCAQDKAVQSLCEGWSRNGIGWVTDTMPSKIEGCTNVILYYGSSSYNVAQMSRLINIIVEDCRQVGIETKSEEEVASLLQQWR